MSISSRMRNIKVPHAPAMKAPAKQPGTEANLVTQDDWSFREQPGKQGVPRRRGGEAHAANVTPPNLLRNRYPNN